MQRHDLLHKLHILHQPDNVVGKQLHRRHRADSAGIESGRMHVTAFHEAEHLAGVTADPQSLQIKRSGEGIEGRHDVRDGPEAVQLRVRRMGLCRLFPNAGIGLLHHFFAEVHAHQIVLEDVVVEHVFGSFAQVDDPLGNGGGAHAKSHVLRIRGACGMVVAADTADAAGDEVGISRVLALHEDAVAAEDRRCAVALCNLALAEVDLCKDAEAAYDPGDRVPIHFH